MLLGFGKIYPELLGYIYKNDQVMCERGGVNCKKVVQYANGTDVKK